MHDEGVAHRDLKHDNILVDGKGHAKLLDLGLAKELINNRTRTRCGTPGYMAPEQVEGREYGVEVDLWAYGILLFELFAGYNPFEDKDNPQNTYSNLTKGVINWAPYMSAESKEFIKKLLLFEPKERMRISNFINEPLFSVTIYHLSVEC
jgi:protein kinase A